MADGVTGDVHTCGCGCGTTSVGESAALDSCGCGCGSASSEPKTREQEVAELEALRDSIDRRLSELAS